MVALSQGTTAPVGKAAQRVQFFPRLTLRPSWRMPWNDGGSEREEDLQDHLSELPQSTDKMSSNSGKGKYPSQGR